MLPCENIGSRVYPPSLLQRILAEYHSNAYPICPLKGVMSTTLPEFIAKFRVSELRVLELQYWSWSIRPAQCTLGAGILSLNRFCTSLGGITKEESSEFGAIAERIERALTAVFHPDKFNFVMLMMVDAHLHFHVIPRYATPRDFFNVRWIDSGWPGFPALADGSQYQHDPVLTNIRDALISPNLSSV